MPRFDKAASPQSLRNPLDELRARGRQSRLFMTESAATAAPASAYSRTNPFPAKVVENRMLSKEGSEKETRHIVVETAGSGLTYQVGDSLGIFASNPPALVDELLAAAQLTGDISVAGKELRHALVTDYTLNRVNKKFVKLVAEKLPEGPAKEKLAATITDAPAFDAYTNSRDPVDVLREFPVALTAEELIGGLTKIAPRLYSIASSPLPHPTAIHLTVGVVRYESHGRKKAGLATGFLADQVGINEADVPVFLQPAKHFHLPADPATDIIMVGPGTGIAPFRAFLQERAATGARGRNWLFFGEQRRSFDFLYEDEFAQFQKDGFLHKLSLAFSRDQAEKIYVQQRMQEEAAELWHWISGGAYFYVCGDAKRMAKDVHQTLIQVVQSQGGLSPESAKEFIEVTLAKTERRYLKDVY